MPIIKLTGVYTDKLGQSAAKRIEGTRIDNGAEWSKKFFADNKELMFQLEEFGVGDIINVKVQQGKNPMHWNIIGFYAVDEEYANKIKGTGAPTGNPTAKRRSSSPSPSPSKSSSSGMSKEEWAEKDRATQVRIAKAVAIKLACDNSKVGTAPEKLIEEANAYIPWLLDSSDPVPSVTGDDPLDPPVD